MADVEIQQMASLLETLEIGHSAAAKYAVQLVDDGYDTPDLLADISEARMQQLGFKQPHIDRVLRARSPSRIQPPHETSAPKEAPFKKVSAAQSLLCAIRQTHTQKQLSCSSSEYRGHWSPEPLRQ